MTIGGNQTIKGMSMIRRISVIAAALFLASPALASETISLASMWNLSVQLTAERSADEPTADIASPGWISADWVLEPAPAHFGTGAFYMRNAWRNKYLTYVFHHNPAEGRRNVQLMDKIVNPATDQRATLARGQVWAFERSPVGPSPDFVRIRPADQGFGQQYLTISQLGENSTQPKYQGFTEPVVAGSNPLHLGYTWFRFKSSHRDQQQCVKNASFTILDVDWYSTRDVKINNVEGRLVLVPESGKKPVLSERKSLGFSSCETSNQRMLASVSLVGRNEVSAGITHVTTALALVTGIGLPVVGAAGIYGSGELLRYLDSKPETVYLGIPGKVTISGTLYSPKAEETERIKH